MNITIIENRIKDLITVDKNLLVDEIEKLGESKLSFVILFKDIFMGSIEYVREKSLDLMVFDIETNSLIYSKTIDFKKDSWDIDQYLLNFFVEFKRLEDSDGASGCKSPAGPSLR